MERITLTNASTVAGSAGQGPSVLSIESGTIQNGAEDKRPSGRIVDLGGATVFPGFIDIHNHGAVGVDVNEADAEGLLAVGRHLARNGVTAWVPTFVPDSDETYRRVVAEIEKAVGLQANEPVARIVGVHYEGIFANTQMCGALRPEYFRTFTGTELAALPTLARGAHLTTFAPEIDGGVDLVRELVRCGWIPSIGHTKATPDVLDAAFAAGARHMTHFFNAMTGLHHRDVGVVGWGLTRDVSIDIIADCIHVHPDLLRFVFEKKGVGNVSLISDSVAPTGLGDGEFELWGERISVAGGRTRNERGSIAGSVITMLDAVLTARSVGVADADIARMASLNPARLLGIESTCGSLDPGMRADLVAIDDDGDVVFAMVGGIPVEV